MEPNKPKFRFRLNLFDSIVLVLALAVGAFLVWSAIKPAAAPAEGAVSAAGTVQYTIRFQKMIQGVSERIKPGDQLVDTVKNYELGTVVSVETVPAQALIQDHEDKAFVLAGIEGYEDALVTVEAPLYRGRGLPPAGRRLQAAGGRDRLCPGLRLYGQRARGFH